MVKSGEYKNRRLRKTPANESKSFELIKSLLKVPQIASNEIKSERFCSAKVELKSCLCKT